MRDIHASAITDAVKKLCTEANYALEPDMLRAFDRALGLKGTMGKGARSEPVKNAMKQHKAVYFGAIGGPGAVPSAFVKKLEIVCYEDLGTEAIRRLEVEGFPAIVVNDCHGGDLYEEGMKQYAR